MFSMDPFHESWSGMEMNLVSGFHADPAGLLAEDKADLVIVSQARPRRAVVYSPLFATKSLP